MSIALFGIGGDCHVTVLDAFERHMKASGATRPAIARSPPSTCVALAAILPQLKTEIVKRCPREGGDRIEGFVTLPKRWFPGSSPRTARTIAWLNRRRRLAKDWENLRRNALAFLKLASIRLMLRKFCNPR